MKYFQWSYSEVMNMSWDNFVLFMASIPRFDESETPGTEKIEEKEAWEIF